MLDRQTKYLKETRTMIRKRQKKEKGMKRKRKWEGDRDKGQSVTESEK